MSINRSKDIENTQRLFQYIRVNTDNMEGEHLKSTMDYNIELWAKRPVPSTVSVSYTHLLETSTIQGCMQKII